MAKPELTPSQERALEITARTASSLSVAGCLFVLITFISSRKFRRPINRIIFFAIWGNFFYNLATLINVTGIKAGVNSPLCQFQGFLIQTFGLVDILWNLSLALNVYLTVYKRYAPENLKKLEIYYIVFNYSVPIIGSFVLIFISSPSRGKIYGSADYWCWISPRWGPLRLALTYDFVWAGILGVFVIYCLAGYRIYMQEKELKSFGLSSMGSKSIDDPRDDPAVAPKKTTEVEVVYENQENRNISAHSSKFEDQMNGIDLEKQPPSNGNNFQPYSVSVGAQNQAQREAAAAATVAAAATAAALAKDFQPDSTARAAIAQRRASTHAAANYYKRAALVFGALIVTWTASTVNRVWLLVHPGELNFGLSYAAISLLPLMGFWNSVTYCVCSWNAVKSIGPDLRAYLSSFRKNPSRDDRG